MEEYTTGASCRRGVVATPTRRWWRTGRGASAAARREGDRTPGGATNASTTTDRVELSTYIPSSIDFAGNVVVSKYCMYGMLANVFPSFTDPPDFSRCYSINRLNNLGRFRVYVLSISINGFMR